MPAQRMDKPFTCIAIVIMGVVFVLNGISSGGLPALGNGRAVDFLGISYETVFENFQLYRLLTYGYTHTAIWHILANGFALWSVGSYLEKRIGTASLVLVYHAGLVLAGTTIFLLFPDSFNYGASPAIFSCFGLLTHWLIRKKSMWRAYRAQNGFAYCALYFVFANFLGWASFAIHFLGFAAGFLLGFFIRENNGITGP